jgi:ferredoxin-NADP reductase
MDFTATVEGNREVGPGTVALDLTAPSEFDGKPGQFVRLTATLDGESVSRFYTISSPDTADTFETTVALPDDDETDDDSPDFAEYLVGLEPGAEINVSGPFGDEFYDGEARAVVLAGGPGIGPAVAIAERALDADNEAAVVYQDDAPAHTERLETLRERGATVTITDGEIRDAVAEAITGDAGEQAFVYGFAAFVDEATAALDDAGYDADEANVENFG